MWGRLATCGRLSIGLACDGRSEKPIINVIPSEAEATLDIRALPDENHHHVLRSHVQGHRRPGG
jgi:acetylornithine deacetylase/succinyl-diaminopimelate desuccinylase-like protein